jgi:hypothetical protein
MVENLASDYFLVLVYRESTYVAVCRNITKISQKSHLGLKLLYTRIKINLNIKGKKLVLLTQVSNLLWKEQLALRMQL